MNKKNILGIVVRGRDFQGRLVACEVLAADGGTTRSRATYEDTGEVWESLYSPDNPKVVYPACAEADPAYKGHLIVRTWRNGDELEQPLAEGYDCTDMCFCMVLGKVFGEDFTDYMHNYLFEDGMAWEGA